MGKWPETVIDQRFEIVRPLGEGGMGAVFEALDRTTNERVAVKVIRAERLANGTSAVRRFEREAQAVGSAASPHIVRFISHGCDAATGAPFIVMELLEGTCLRTLLRRTGTLPPELAIRIAIQVCRGLAHAHAIGVVHRDVKPGNLFIAREAGGAAVLKILDFGLAKLAHPESDPSGSLTASDNVLGSPAYMCPEQALAVDGSDPRGDLWSLGVVLYEALSGRLPFGDRASLGQTILAICSEPPMPLRHVAPGVSASLAAVVHRALTKARVDRFATADEMRVALEAAATGDLEIAFSEIEELPCATRSHGRLPSSARSVHLESGDEAARGDDRFRTASRTDGYSDATIFARGVASVRLVSQESISPSERGLPTRRSGAPRRRTLRALPVLAAVAVLAYGVAAAPLHRSSAESDASAASSAPPVQTLPATRGSEIVSPPSHLDCALPAATASARSVARASASAVHAPPRQAAPKRAASPRRAAPAEISEDVFAP